MEKSHRTRTENVLLVALCAALIAVCAWIIVPGVIPFTMQTFGVFFAVALLGGKKGAAAVALYLLLGVLGLPVFSGFTGGVGVLFGASGGYLMGLLWIAGCGWMTEPLCRKKPILLVLFMLIGLFLCYASGTVWFCFVHAGASVKGGVWSLLTVYVLPFLLPDVLKLAAAVTVAKRLRNVLPAKP